MEGLTPVATVAPANHEPPIHRDEPSLLRRGSPAAMQSVLLLGIHCHQPDGNFDHVFRKAFDACYRPLLDVLARHPSVKIALHYSGTLMEWLEKNRRDYLDRVRLLQDGGQVEILGGGMYEPILPSIPPEDARSQIGILSEYLDRIFARPPRGIWLTERVWSPCLAYLLPRSGVEFTALDDTHFLSAGLREDDLCGYYVTEGGGRCLALFPIRKALRYSIPFSPAEEIIGRLKRMHEEKGPLALTYADDGEKFGLWPGTHRWVYDEGWLERFLTLLERNTPWLRTMGFSEYLDAYPAAGRVYLPTSSYDEMTEWALPEAAQREYKALLEDLDGAGLRDRARGFLKGGWWENFLVKYPEANLLHKRMLFVGERLSGEGRTAQVPEWIWREYYKSQANDVYWHGLFGGLYFQFLRKAAYGHLIRCEQELDVRTKGGGPWADLTRVDIDADRQEEILLSNPWLQAIVDPADGGALLELDWRPGQVNVTNVITRRPEAYHADLKGLTTGAGAGGSAGPKTIHHIQKAKEGGLEKVVIYDRYQRWSFLDHVLSSDANLDTWRNCTYDERGDFLHAPYTVVECSEAGGESVTVKIIKDGSVTSAGGSVPLRVEKTFSLGGAEPGLEVRYALDSPGPLRSAWFAVEMNLGLLLGRDRMRYIEVGDERDYSPSGERKGMSKVTIVDEAEGFSLVLGLDPPGALWWFLIETVSNSEDGIERTPQGSALLIRWPLPQGGTFRPVMALTVGPR